MEQAAQHHAAKVRESERYVLAVDDDEIHTEAIRQVLRSSSVRIAVTGDQALQVLRSHAPIDLLITDLEPLGPFDGFALARQARALRPGLCVIYTSRFPVVMRADDFSSPDGEVVVAPVSARELRGAVERAFDVAGA